MLRSVHTENIRDQIIEGNSDRDTVEQLLKQPDLTLEAAITLCRAQEAANKQRREISDHTAGTVFTIREHRHPPATQPPVTCPGFGAKPHMGGRVCCPAYNQTCHHCNKTGHFSRVCRARQTKLTPSKLPGDQPAPTPSTKTLQITQPNDPHPPQLQTIRQVTAAETAPTIGIRILTVNGSCDTLALPDSGADISAAGPQLLKLLNEHTLNLLPSKVTPKTANGHKMQPLGKLPITFQLCGRDHREDMHIYPGVSGVIMSWKTAKGLNILPEHYPDPVAITHTAVEPAAPKLVEVNVINTVADIPKKSEMINMYPTVFDGQIRVMPGKEFHISVIANAQPFCVHTPWTIPFAYRDRLKAELHLLQSQNIITPVTEATTWCAPIVVTPKKNSHKISLCVDLSHLNRFVIGERYQFLTPAEIVADIAASHTQVFTVLEALKEYHQCPLDQESQILTTFITPFDRYKYLRVPYGISSISEHYNRHMSEAFIGISGFRRVVDDFVIYDSNITDHISHVQQFLQCCKENNIALNTDKCQFFQSQVTFAGFQLSASGYKIDSSIIEAITNYPTPSSRSDLRSFIGLVNQLSTSTNTIATMLAPLRPLLSTKNEFLWSNHHQEAFVQVKTSLTTSPMLSFYDINKPTRLSTDASRHGLGFIL